MAYGSCDQQSSALIGKAALPPPARDDLHPSNQAWLPDFTFLVACPPPWDLLFRAKQLFFEANRTTDRARNVRARFVPKR